MLVAVIAGLVFVAGNVPAHAQEAPPEQSAPAEVSLPTPTVLPDSPFYFIGRFFEETKLFFTFGAETRARAHLRIAEKRLAEAKALAERKEEKSKKLAERVMARYQKRIEKVQQEAEKTDEQTAKNLADAYLKHIRVLNRVAEKVPEQARQGIDRALENARRLRERKAKEQPVPPPKAGFGAPDISPDRPTKIKVKKIKPADDNGIVFCTQEYDPVCGIDSETYSNRCVAENQNKVKVAYRGECRPEQCEQGFIFNPVTKKCVPDGFIGPPITLREPDSFTVLYTSIGYIPADLTTIKGETITWVNESDQPMWTASAIHPTHTVYPVGGGCIGSAFDACRKYNRGSSWSFKFDKVGIWNYHNHLIPGHRGVVTVIEWQ